MAIVALWHAMAVAMARDGDSFEVVTPAMIAAGVELFKQMRVGLSNASVVERIYRAILGEGLSVLRPTDAFAKR